MVAFVSFVIPAYNEANQIGAVVDSIQASARALKLRYEVIVADDSSTDETAEIARRSGARVISLQKRQIAAVRNGGALEAQGDVLVFVDGDTYLNPQTLAASLKALELGAVAGGALCRFDSAPRSGRWAMAIGTRLLRWAHLCGGCYVFVLKDVFQEVGGFDETLYASEEIAFARAAAKRGPFVVVKEPITTSGRKFRRFSGWSILRQVANLGRQGRRGLKRREGLDFWYDGVRESKDSTLR